MERFTRRMRKTWGLDRKVEYVARRGAGQSVSIPEMAKALSATIRGLLRTLPKFNISVDTEHDQVHFPKAVRWLTRPEQNAAKRDKPVRVSGGRSSRTHGAGRAHSQEDKRQ